MKNTKKEIEKILNSKKDIATKVELIQNLLTPFIFVKRRQQDTFVMLHVLNSLNESLIDEFFDYGNDFNKKQRNKF